MRTGGTALWALPALVLAGTLTLPVTARAQADLTVGDDASRPTETAEVAIFLASGAAATALQVDVSFDPARLAAGTPSGGGGLADHVISSVEPAAGLLRLVVHSPTNAALPVGEIVRIPFGVAAGAAAGTTPLVPIAGEVATPAATSVLPLTLVPGSVHIFTAESDVGVDLTADRNLVADGDLLVYTIVASNPGPEAASAVELSDVIPPELVGAAWTCAASGGATCAPTGSGDVLDSLDLPVGGSTVHTVTATVDTGADHIDNLAELTPPPEVFDPAGANNSDGVTVDVCVIDDLVLTDWNIGGIAVFNACVSLTAGPDFNVQPTGEVTLRSLGSVVLTDGLSVESGGRLAIETP